MSRFYIVLTAMGFIIGILPTALFGFSIHQIEWWLIVVPANIVLNIILQPLKHQDESKIHFD